MIRPTHTMQDFLDEWREVLAWAPYQRGFYYGYCPECGSLNPVRGHNAGCGAGICPKHGEYAEAACPWCAGTYMTDEDELTKLDRDIAEDAERDIDEV